MNSMEKRIYFLADQILRTTPKHAVFIEITKGNSYSVAIARKLRVCQATVHWHIRSLERDGLIKKGKRDKAQHYEVV